MTWAGRRDHLGEYMTPPANMPSSLGQGARRSLEWSYIPRPSVSLMLKKGEDKKQKNMSSQRTSRELKNYGGFYYIEDGRGCIIY